MTIINNAFVPNCAWRKPNGRISLLMTDRPGPIGRSGFQHNEKAYKTSIGPADLPAKGQK